MTTTVISGKGEGIGYEQVAKRIANIRFARDNRGTAMYRIMIVEDDEVIARAVQQSLDSLSLIHI